jgi:CheY-like chemotaxis protein
MSTNRLRVLLVEDDAVHAKIIRRTLERRGHIAHLRHVETGDAALDHVLRRKPDVNGADAFSPDLILLDIRLPTIDGFDVLKAIRADDHACRTPVVMVTTSEDPYEVRKAYEMGANAYISKPTDFDALAAKLTSLDHFFSEAVELPR